MSTNKSGMINFLSLNIKIIIISPPLLFYLYFFKIKKMLKRISKIFVEDKKKPDHQEMNSSLEIVMKNSGIKRQITEKIHQIEQSSIEIRRMKKYERSMSEFTQSDQDLRNILHRAALEQNPKLIQDILEEYCTVCHKDNTVSLLANYVNQKDKFGLTPIQMCCFSNTRNPGLSDGGQPRCESIKALHKAGANLNEINPRTLWFPIHWVACYGDALSLGYLIENNCIAFNTDYQGFYPLDLAGRSESKNCGEQLIKYLTGFLSDYEKWKYQSRRHLQPSVQNFIEECFEKDDRHLSNPLLKISLLYWGCYFKVSQEQLTQIFNLRIIYILAPLYSANFMTPLHIAVKMNNVMALKALLEQNNKLKKELLDLAESRNHDLRAVVTQQRNNVKIPENFKQFFVRFSDLHQEKHKYTLMNIDITYCNSIIGKNIFQLISS